MLLPKINKFVTMLSIEETETIIGLIDTPMAKAALILIYCCGLRLEEGISIKTKDIDIAGKRLLVRGLKGARDRIVPLPEVALRSVIIWMSSNKCTDWLFPGREGHPHASTLQLALKRATLRSGIKMNVSVASLRRARAVHLFEDCASLDAGQAFLGHINLSMTALLAKGAHVKVTEN